MNQPVIKAIFLISILILCMTGVSAAGDFAVDDTFTQQNAPDFSSCNITNGSTINPYCPLWDGEHTQPDPYLVYKLHKKLEAASLKSQGVTPSQDEYDILSLPPPQSEFPTTGTVRVPVFLVDFSDAPHDPSQTAADVQLKMFGDGNGGYPYESLKNYYQRSSYNQLTITGDVYGWYRAAQPRSYYMNLGKTQGRDALINEILLAYNNQINFANYDSNSNGRIDALFIKWAGSDTGWGTFWWASMSGVSSPVTVDGVTPKKYVWSWYSRPNGGAYSPQVDMHETGHILGLPDYYDYDDSIGPKGGLGGWDMMDYNWGDHNSFSKYLLGWIDPVVISSGTNQIILPPSETTSSGNTVLIMPNAVPDSFGEFFLVQYREPGTGNDPLKTGLNKAVWIWHVDSTLSGGGGYLYDNSYTDHKLLRLMEADGLEEIETGTGNWDVYDFYVPGKALGPATVPNSNSYSGSSTNVAVYNMIQLPSTMQVDFSIAGAPVAPVAGFSANVTSGTAPLTVKFTDTSTGTGLSAWKWDFKNDGSVDSTAQSPTYTYTSAGTYTVNLTVTGTAGSDSEIKANYITVTAVPVVPVAGFSANVTSGTAPLTVKFTDSSTGTGLSAWKWDFKNDGSVDSTTQSPTYTYTSAGTYTVNLTVTGTAGSDSEIKTNYITVTSAPVAPVAGFSANVTSGTAPLTVKFTDSSTGTGLSAWKWDFKNDGSVDSTTQSPSYTYTSAGTYTINLTVTGTAGTDSEIKSNYITVTSAPVAPVAGFSANVTSGTAPLTVKFTDSSTGTGLSAWKWDFKNDGSVDSTTQSPTYTYTSPGTYTVNLTITGTAGTDSEIKSDYITVAAAPVVPVAGFSANVTYGTAPLTVKFTDTSTGTGLSAWKWDFKNDGSVDSTTQSPTYTYTTAGTYTVNLTVTGTAGTDSELKSNYITVTSAPVAPVAGFSANVTSGTAPLTVKFTDISSGVGITAWNWSFGDGTWERTTSSTNPVHTYAVGTWYPTLTVTTASASNTSLITPARTISVTSPPASSITVTSPNGGETWQRGTTHTVTWDYTGSPGSTVKIMLLKAGIEVGTINASTSIGSGGKGSYTWQIYPTGSTGVDYKVSVQSISQPTIKDMSNNYFTITAAGTTASSITVTSPNGGETWQRGTMHTVTWDYTGSPGSTVKIMLLKAGIEVGTINASTSIGSGGKGSYTWQIYPTGSTGVDYKVSVQSISQPTIKDMSKNYFTITAAGTTASSITVTSPNGGETWQRGTTRTVTWDYTRSPGSTVKIMLLKGGVEIGTLASSAPIGSSGKGSYTWPISSSGYTGSDFKVSVQSTSQSTIKDVSDNYFTIISPPPPTTTPSITITSPNGGETWTAGTSKTITWNYTGSPMSTVKIEFLKGGVPITIGASVPVGSGGKGSYTYSIWSGRTPGTDYKVRIQSTSQPAILDMSDNYFTITS